MASHNISNNGDDDDAGKENQSHRSGNEQPLGQYDDGDNSDHDDGNHRNNYDDNDDDNDGIHFNIVDMNDVTCSEVFRSVGRSLLYSHSYGCEHVIYLTNMKYVMWGGSSISGSNSNNNNSSSYSSSNTREWTNSTNSTSINNIDSNDNSTSPYPRTIYRAIRRKRRYTIIIFSFISSMS